MSSHLKIIVLILIAGFLAFAAYQQFGFFERDEKLTQAERELLLPLPDTASDEERARHLEFVASQAKTAERLEIDGCSAKPLVYEMKLGDTIKVRNTGSYDVNFYLGGVEVSIPTGKTVAIKPDFKNAPGLYGFNCADPDFKGPTGIIYVAP